MSDKYPLFPELSEAGQDEAQQLIDKFKDQMRKVAEEILGELYCDVAVHIESDSWSNYRNKMMAGFRDYGNRMVQCEHNFKEIRQQIYKDFRADIIKDLDQDNLAKIEELKRELAYERDLRRDRY